MIAAFLVSLALAEEPETEKLPISLNAGILGVVTPEPAWYGQYTYFGASTYLPLSDRVGFIPALSFQAAPGSGNWGFAFTTTVDLAVSEHVGLDLTASVLQDTPPSGPTGFIVCAGPGVTIMTKNYVSVSVALQAANIVGTPIWVGIPALNLAVPIPY